MKVRHAVMVGLLGQQRDRFHTYTQPRPLAERLELMHQIPGCEGVEPVYPSDLRDLERDVQTVKASGWPVSAVNLNVKGDAKWREGSFTSTDPQIRADAVRDLKTAMDIAVDLGTDLVTCCPLIDGHNYNFQVDYVRQWQWLREGIAEAANYRRDVRISLEFKINEARNYCILADSGRALYLCSQIGAENVGITYDVGHALIASETPAATMALVADAGKLFYMHFNDNDRVWDWDMIPGSVHVWDLLETLYYLERVDWEGWFCYDVLTRSGDDVLGVQVTTLEIMHMAQQLLDKIGREHLDELIAAGSPPATMRHLWASLL
ncbi:MAG: sugar phosphate isomerase/epimerase [Chloroflexi bacterium]|nr:sugar phosphate isomerase/epimerase [Chloroflexota bacterium]